MSTMSRPVVGITCYVERAQWGVWDTRAALLPVTYVEQVEAAGGRPVILPPTTAGHDEALDSLDAIIFAGGADLDPALYGQQAHPQTTGIRGQRDAAEVALMRAALDRDLPLLGICRGMQLMAAVHGGSLIQHLPDQVGHERHRPAPGEYGVHEVRFAPGSRVEAILGSATTVPSYHHQGVDSPGSLAITGWADDDTPEVVEHPNRTFAIGVLWHPEASDDGRLFEALVNSAGVRAG